MSDHYSPPPNPFADLSLSEVNIRLAERREHLRELEHLIWFWNRWKSVQTRDEEIAFVRGKIVALEREIDRIRELWLEAPVRLAENELSRVSCETDIADLEARQAELWAANARERSRSADRSPRPDPTPLTKEQKLDLLKQMGLL